MIVDYDQDTAPLVYDCDICIVGSGATALALLTKFYDTSLRVVVLEAGGEDITVQSQDMYKVVTPYHPFPGAEVGRFRVFGGSTTKWGGQTLPLDPIDFKKRDWVPFSGWPLPYQEIAKYYPEVDEFLGVEAHDYESDIYKLLREKRLQEDDILKFRFSKWSPKPNLREGFRKQLVASANVTLVQHASVIAINLFDNHKQVSDLVISNLAHKKGRVRATTYVIACGGIENARLLLASRHQLSKGIGNSHDVVGRFLQDHPNAHIGHVTQAKNRTQRYFNYFYIKKTRFLPRLILTEKFQTTHKLLNASASLLFFSQGKDAYSQVLDIYRKRARGKLGKEDVQSLLKLGLQAHQLVKPVMSMLVRNKVFTPNPTIKLNLMIENPPEWHNRVALSDQRDALGIPLASVEWKVGEQVRQTLITSAGVFADYIARLGFGQLQLADWIQGTDWKSYVGDASHHIGTTRMSNSEIDGVVNTDCQVFGVNNLYIAGSSVFPTSGHSNPTSTLIALAFRLGEHLKATVETASVSQVVLARKL
jgi:choline dehydrogenase-like flavoprotein